MATGTETLFQINKPRIVENFDSRHDIVLKNGDTLKFDQGCLVSGVHSKANSYG